MSECLLLDVATVWGYAMASTKLHFTHAPTGDSLPYAAKRMAVIRLVTRR